MKKKNQQLIVKLQDKSLEFPFETSIFKVQRKVCKLFVEKLTEFLNNYFYCFLEKERFNCRWMRLSKEQKTKIIWDNNNVMRKHFDRTNKKGAMQRILAGKDKEPVRKST